jgi:hypothetical protein
VSDSSDDDGASQTGVITTLAMNSGDEASLSRQCQADAYGSEFAGLEAHTLLLTCELKRCPIYKLGRFKYD